MYELNNTYKVGVYNMQKFKIVIGNNKAEANRALQCFKKNSMAEYRHIPLPQHTFFLLSCYNHMPRKCVANYHTNQNTKDCKLQDSLKTQIQKFYQHDCCINFLLEAKFFSNSLKHHKLTFEYHREASDLLQVTI